MVAQDSLGAMLARHGRTLQDWKDPAGRKSFLRAYGREHVSWSSVICCAVLCSQCRSCPKCQEACCVWWLNVS